MHRPDSWLLPFVMGLALAAPLVGQAQPEEAPVADPSKAEVELSEPGAAWRATLVLDNGETGVWTVKSFPVFEQYACPELVALDDQGRCIVLVSYSGKWTPNRILEEKQWLGGLAHDDVDPRRAGAEIYTGGKRGNLYQVVAYSHGALDARLIAHLPGHEIHTVLAGQLDPRVPTSHLLVFTRPGALYRVTPTGPDGGFETRRLVELPGRVRDALVLPSREGRGTEIVTVARSGQVALLQLTEEGLSWSSIHEGPMGVGRVALAPERAGRATVLYTTHDDGTVLRHERLGDDAWLHTLIYAGPQGPRGIATGRFDSDPDVETLAVFGYSKKVQLLSRRESGWEVETIFEDCDKGHWLCAAELDGRNGTTELFGSGYGARVFQLSRPPGYGLDDVAVEADGERRLSVPTTIPTTVVDDGER